MKRRRLLRCLDDNLLVQPAALHPPLTANTAEDHPDSRGLVPNSARHSWIAVQTSTSWDHERGSTALESTHPHDERRASDGSPDYTARYPRASGEPFAALQHAA